MQRYSHVTAKNPREILLLKSLPCKWGRCSFCDYIDDNGHDAEALIAFNHALLEQVTGEYGVLEVINSGSVFELPDATVDEIIAVVEARRIGTVFFESHYMYRKQLDGLRARMPGVELIFKTGIETFDDHYRNHVLNKGVRFANPEEVAGYFQSICLLVGIEGQTQAMVRRDIELLQQYFTYGCVNLFIENSTGLRKDAELIRWFEREYAYLEQHPTIEVLWHNTDFGVGELEAGGPRR